MRYFAGWSVFVVASIFIGMGVTWASNAVSSGAVDVQIRVLRLPESVAHLDRVRVVFMDRFPNRLTQVQALRTGKAFCELDLRAFEVGYLDQTYPVTQVESGHVGYRCDVAPNGVPYLGWNRIFTSLSYLGYFDLTRERHPSEITLTCFSEEESPRTLDTSEIQEILGAEYMTVTEVAPSDEQVEEDERKDAAARASFEVDDWELQ